MRKREIARPIHAGHRSSGDERIDDRLFGGLDDGLENRIDIGVSDGRDRGWFCLILIVDVAGRCREADDQIAGRIAGIKSRAEQDPKRRASRRD